MNHMRQVIDGGYCIGCGACDCASDGAISIAMDESGMYQADVAFLNMLSDDALNKALAVCPFSNDGPNEDAFGKGLFGRDCSHDPQIGYYKDLYIGYVAEDDFRVKGTSGGVITWVLTELLKKREIDAVAHVKKVEAQDDGILFRYGISRTADEIMAGAKSRYYPIEMSDVLKQIKSTPGRYAVVGLPCFIKAVRRLAEIDPVIKERIVYTVGLVCGHLKSKAFADCFGWQAGIPPGQLEEIDFRVKLPDRTAGDYGVYLRGAGKEITKPTREFLGSNWGHNFFRYPACDFCDDVFAETADIVIGDAWLPEYEKDPNGNSVIVLRNKELGVLVKAACEEKRLVFVDSTADQIADSQSGGLRDRREGLAYRLCLGEKGKKWMPLKRVVAESKHINKRRKKIYQIRSKIGLQSHRVWQVAVQKKEYSHFEKGAKTLERIYQWSYRPFVDRVRGRLERIKAHAENVFGVWRKVNR